MEFVEVSAHTTTTISSPVFESFDFEKIEYRADFLDADQSAQAAHLTDPDYVEKLRTMVR